MVSTLATLVLSFGLASASALPPLGKAAPPPPQGPPPPPPAPYHSISSGSVISVTPSATSAVEPSATGSPTDVTSAPSASTTESSVPATCDTDLTSTATLTHDYPNTVYDYVTSYLPTSTGTFTVYTSVPNSTVSYYLGTSTKTSIVNNIGTTTQTFYDYVSTGICTSTETIAAESTSTVYTGSFTPTQLPTYCPTSMSYVEVYAGDEVTETYTFTSLPLVKSTTTISTASTAYYYGPTVTETVPVSVYEYETAISTQTYASVCTSTSYTATASTTTTQSAKCAPTNFVTNLSSVSNGDGLDAKNLWQGESPANKDASTCCQACVEDPECAAMDFYPHTGCTLYLGSECGKSIQVAYDFPGAEGFSAQAGCGSIVLKYDEARAV